LTKIKNKQLLPDAKKAREAKEEEKGEARVGPGQSESKGGKENETKNNHATARVVYLVHSSKTREAR
jgi:hypothetical protein